MFLVLSNFVLFLVFFLTDGQQLQESKVSPFFVLFNERGGVRVGFYIRYIIYLVLP